jgi:hypothetical protein
MAVVQLRVTGRRGVPAALCKTSISGDSGEKAWGGMDTQNGRSSHCEAAQLHALCFHRYDRRTIDLTCNSRRSCSLADRGFDHAIRFYFQRYGSTAISYFPNEHNGRRRAFTGEPLGRQL